MSIDERLAYEEESDMTDDEKKYFFTALESLDPSQAKHYIADPFDTLVLIRAFRNEIPRLEITCKNLRSIAEWRESVEFDSLLLKRLDKDERFHNCWPEKLYGHDKYGHLILGSRISELKCDELEKFEESEIERLQGQKLKALMAIKREQIAFTGVRRYKHTAVIDLSGLSMSMLSGNRRAMLKRVMDIGKYLFPETCWKIYILNAPFVFRAVWHIIKPWLHPKTLAKIKILPVGTSPAQAMEPDGERKTKCASCWHTFL